MPSLWQNRLLADAFCRSSDESADGCRDHLRSALTSLRGRAAVLADQIKCDQPHLTVHDLTHSDALWDMADLIAGRTFGLNAAEAFVLGAAFLIHDLGNAAVAYAVGDDVRDRPLYQDTVAQILHRAAGRPPTAREIASASETVRKLALESTLRKLHANHAENLLVNRSIWPNIVLIDDLELRQHYGRLIGQIAGSHGWDLETLQQDLPRLVGSLPAFPHEWTIRPLLLAALLRVADKSHVDRRRAPWHEKMVRKPTGIAAEHWTFQIRLHRPILNGDRLLYTATDPFLKEETAAWWRCFEALQEIDQELSCVDRFLSDLGETRFAASGVAGVEHPSRFVKYVPVLGWEPVDARIRISDPQNLIQKLGGRWMYGDNAAVPLRELIQNALDAIRARRIVEGRPNDWGQVIVRRGTDVHGPFIEVADNGVGMSKHVLSNVLLDFGRSLWTDDCVVDEFAGLAASGFTPTGRFGIGFYSVLMWGSRVTVVSRRYDASCAETHVVEIIDGTLSRPTLRRAEPEEVIRDGGTTVRVSLSKPFPPASPFASQRLGDWVATVGVAADCDIRVIDGNADPEWAVRANDWERVDGETLYRRLFARHTSAQPSPEVRQMLDQASEHLRFVTARDGRILGRAAIYHFGAQPSIHGVVTVGGMACNGLAGFFGIMFGETERASRDRARPIATQDDLAEWGQEQLRLLLAAGLPSWQAIRNAHLLWLCGVKPFGLPIARDFEGELRLEDITVRFSSSDPIRIVNEYYLRDLERLFPDFGLDANVIVVPGGYGNLLPISPFADNEFDKWPLNLNGLNDAQDQVERIRYSPSGLVIEALAAAWGSTFDRVLAASFPTAGWNDTERIAIATAGGQPISVPVNQIRRPT